MIIKLRELLEARAAAAFTLKEFDDEARAAGRQRLIGVTAKHRRILSDNLYIYGGQTWPYSAVEDNSWIKQ